jgi:Protein of unknown function (DUF2934)
MARQAAWAATNEDEKAATLEREFEASMQAIMAAAIAIDSFYSLIQTQVQLPPELLNRWHAKRTARYAQVTEVLRRALQLQPKGIAALRQNLKEIYRFRDLAIHPSGGIEAPILHPELNIGVEWRFAFFHAHNAELVVNVATWILWDLAHRGKPREPKIAEYMNGLRQQLAQLRHRVISEAAYYSYAQRGYADGYDLDDWLQAEARTGRVFPAGARRPPQAAPPA